MLGSKPTVSFVPSTSLARSKEFFGKVLELQLKRETQASLDYRCGEGTLTVISVAGMPGFKPQSFTIVGWNLEDVSAAVRNLQSRGVVFERYEGFEQDELAIWTAPSGSKVAWFKDPDGNVLSVSSLH